MADLQTVFTSQNTPFGWTINGTAAANDAVESPDASTYLSIDAGSGGESNNLLTLASISTIPDGSAINSVSVHTVSGRSASGPGTYRWRMKLGGNTTEGVDRNPGTTWTTFDDACAKPGGGQWTKTDLTNAFMTLFHNSNGTPGVLVFVDYIRIDINYTPPVGGFAFALA